MSDYEISYDWGDDAPVGDELSLVDEHMAGLPADVPSDAQHGASDSNLRAFENDSGDGGDYANQPQRDPLTALAVEAFEKQWTQQEEFEAWQADYAQRHNAAMEAKAAEQAAEGTQLGDQIIGSVYGGHVTEQDRHLTWAAAEALKDQEYSRLQREGYDDRQIAKMCLEGAAHLVREVGVTNLALKKA